MKGDRYRTARELAREQREREERSQTTLLRRKRGIAAGLALILGGLICVAIVQWMLQPAATEVSGRLGGVREIAFVEGTQSSGGISPVCGCADPALDSWRGIEFAGRRVSLRHAEADWAQWLVSSAEPESIGLIGGRKVMVVHAFRLSADGFDPLDFARAHSKHGRAHGSSIEVRAPTFSILTRGELRLALPGPIPIGAWIPFPDSRVSLTATRSPFPDLPRRPRLVERYSPQVGYWPDRSGESHPKEPQVYPLGDFLGPNLVLWTDDPQARIVGTAFGKAAGPDTVTALVVSSSIFSTRIGVTPFPGSYVGLSEEWSLEEPDSAAERGIDSSGTSGTVTLTVDQPLAPEDYARVRGLVAADPKKWVVSDINPEYGSGARSEYAVLEEQRFPPLPNNAGFNVFGPLKTVSFRDIRGHLTVADKHVDLRGSGDLTLNDVKAFRNLRGEELISAPLATAGESVDLQFGAHGTVWVNGVAQKTVESDYAAPIRILGILLGLIGSVITIVNGLRGREKAG